MSPSPPPKVAQPGRTVQSRTQPVHRNADPRKPFDDPLVVSRYEDWYAGAGRRADRLEKKLLAQLLAGFQDAQSALEVGCGTGHFMRWLAERGLKVTGLDASSVVIAEAEHRGTPSCVLGDAEALPFDAGAFDLVLFITALEFIPDPLRALAEAVRVARRGVLIGALNRYSHLGLWRRSSSARLWRSARLFSPGELVRLARHASGQRMLRVLWRTTIWPFPGTGALPLPWGGFIGLALHLKSDHHRGRK